MDEHQMAQIASIWDAKFKNAMVAKSDYTKKWQRYWDAYNNEYFKNTNLPDYKSNYVSNYIFSIIETIRPVMLDNDPQFQAVPRQPEGLGYASDLHEAFSYEWDREDMSAKLYRDLITTLVTGTSVYFLPWDSKSKEVKCISINGFNLFPDPLATSPEDAEYIIYATYKHEGILKKIAPHLADKLSGGGVNYGELVNDNDNSGARIDNQILVLEVWCRDWSEEMEEMDGIKKSKLKYPHGRVLTICPELGLVLSDKQNPYKDGMFPFVLIKDYDIPGKFWGEGEVAQLIDPQTAMNEMLNSVIDNAKHTANMPWIIDKNSGIGVGKITNRPGLVIRKNPGSDVKRDQPPSMPSYIQNAIADMKDDMAQVSGVFDSLKGSNETGVYTAQGILALQEAGQARIRLKVKILERSLGKLATLWYSRMKQFWKDEKWVRLTRHDGTYDFKKFRQESLKYDYDVKITAGSTMSVNRGAMLDLMIRLAQTQMPDGQPLVDREAVVYYLPEEVKSTLLRRMNEQGTSMDVLTQQLEELSQLSEQGDEETMGVVEQLVGAIENINQQILQLKEEHVRMIEEAKEESKIEEVRKQSYNEGFTDAERLGTGVDEPPEMSLPDELLEGLETLTDDQLQLILQQNPELAELINMM